MNQQPAERFGSVEECHAALRARGFTAPGWPRPWRAEGLTLTTAWLWREGGGISLQLDAITYHPDSFGGRALRAAAQRLSAGHRFGPYPRAGT
jgi:hypothetical protein